MNIIKILYRLNELVPKNKAPINENKNPDKNNTMNKAAKNPPILNDHFTPGCSLFFVMKN